MCDSDALNFKLKLSTSRETALESLDTVSLGAELYGLHPREDPV